MSLRLQLLWEESQKHKLRAPCLPGWYALTDRLGERLAMLVRGEERYRLHIVEAKEKFGGLRIYFRDDFVTPGLRRRVAALIHAAQDASLETCCYCGAVPARQIMIDQWVTTLCEVCRNGAGMVYGGME